MILTEKVVGTVKSAQVNTKLVWEHKRAHRPPMLGVDGEVNHVTSEVSAFLEVSRRRILRHSMSVGSDDVLENAT